MNAGERLASVQLRGHMDADAVYQALADGVESAVLRHAVRDSNGAPRVNVAAVSAVLLDVGRLLDRARPVLIEVVLSAVRGAVDAAQAGVEPLRGDVAMFEAATATRPAQHSLITSRQGVLRQTTALLLSGVKQELAATAVARTVRQYFSPFFAPRRDASGTLLRADREGAIRYWPGRAGMASERVRLVMLTETTAAHGRTMRRIARRDDELIRYTLSILHIERDSCDERARRDVGFGPGLYLPNDAPSVPEHPRCRCYFERGGKVPFPEEQMAITGLRRGFPL